MNTLTGIEAERVVQILKHVSDRLRILAYVPAEENTNVLSEMVNDSTIETLERQWHAELQLKNLNDGNYSDAGGRDISVIKQAHRAVRATSRQLLMDRDSLQILMNVPEAHSDALTKFIRYLNDLSSYIHSRLTTTVEDEAANRTTLQELTEKERHAEESRDALQSKLAEVCEEKEHVTFGLDQTLRKLQVELLDLTSSNKIELDSIQVEMNEAISKTAVDHDLRMRHLQDQVDGLERQLLDATEKNREEEQRLRKDKTRAENGLNNKIAQYDADMASRKVEYDALKADYNAELEEYNLLSEYFNRMDLDADRDADERAILELIEKREEYGMLYLHTAVSKIQAVVRGRQVRNSMKNSKSKNKKGGKKDKKGKKK